MEIEQQQQTPQQTIGTASKASFEVSGVSRSGRVRKKSSKLLDFQSPDEVENKKVKRSAIKNTLVLNSSGVPRYSGRGRPSNAMKARRALLHAAEQQQQQLQMDEGDDLDDLDMELRIGGKLTTAPNGIHQLQTSADDAKAHNASALLNTSTASAGTAPPDSDDELINLVADLVEGVEAEMVNDGNPNDTRVRQSLYMIEKSNKRKMLKDGKVITGKQERKDKGKSRYTAYSMWARELRKAGKLGKNQDMDFSNTARRLGELWANVSNKEKNAWRRKAKKLSSKERLREKTTGSSGGGNYGKKSHTMPLLNNNSAGSSNNNNATTANNNNANFLNRATTSRTRKLAAERIQQQQQQKQPVLTSKNSQSKSIHNSSSSRINSLRQSQSQSDISPPTTPTSAEGGGEVRRKRTYTHRAKAGRITNGNATPSTSMTANSKRLEVDKHNSAAKATTATSGVRTSTLKTKMPTRVLTNNSGSPLKTRAKATQSPNNVTAACSTPTSTTSSSSATTAISQAVAPIDAAAHLKLLGESLTIIGERLKEHDGQIALSGSLSVLLDSLICSMGPLMCLTAFIPGLEQNEQLKSNLAETLDNIAYVMPGL